MGTIEKDKNRSIKKRPSLGIFLMIFGLALYPISDAILKHLMTSYSVPQTSFLRSTTRLIPLLIAVYFQGGPITVLKTQKYKSHLTRLAVNLGLTYSFMFAFSLGSLTSIYTLAYSSSFFMIILSKVILEEEVSREKWIAVAVGMLGVFIAMRPEAQIIESASLLVLLGAFLGALNKILMRQLAATEHSLAITIYPNIMMIIFSLPMLWNNWQSMPLKHWVTFLLVGLITATAQYSIAQAMRFSQGSDLAPFDYSTFFWVVALDFFYWEKSPDISTILGASLIVATNIYILKVVKIKENKKKLSKQTLKVPSFQI